MVGAALYSVLQRGEGAGDCSGDGVTTGAAEHPVCGDHVQLSVRHGDGVIHELRWRATGCPASMAVAALAAKVLCSVRVADAAAVLHRQIGEHGGLAPHERHAESIVLRALAAATGA